MFFWNINWKHFSWSYGQFFTVPKIFREIFPRISENSRYILMHVLGKYCFWCTSAFAECLSEHSNQFNYLSLVAGLCMGIYEAQQIHMKTGSRPTRLEYNQSGSHTFRMAYNNRFYLHTVAMKMILLNICVYSGFLPWKADWRPLRQFAPPPEIWSENNRKISITKEICITTDLAPPEKNSWKKASTDGLSSRILNSSKSFGFRTLPTDDYAKDGGLEAGWFIYFSSWSSVWSKWLRLWCMLWC